MEKIDKMFFHLTKKTTNKKTGSVAVTTSSSHTCPQSCSMKGEGCYAETGPLAWHWNAVTDGKRGASFATHLDEIAELPKRLPLRLNQAGDLPLVNGSVSYAVTAFDRVVPEISWTYTHHELTSRCIDAIKNTEKLTVNISCDTLVDADTAISMGLLAVTVVSDSTSKVSYTKAGNKVIVCPAQTVQNMTCEKCLLCAKKNRKCVVGFRAHGARKNTVEKRLRVTI